MNKIVDKEKNKEIKKLVRLMLKSSDSHPHYGKFSKELQIHHAIELAKFVNNDFAKKGYSDEALNVSSDDWEIVISELEEMQRKYKEEQKNASSNI